MYWATAMLLLANWVLGLVSGARLGVWIHFMFALALVSLALGALTTLANNRRPLGRRHP